MLRHLAAVVVEHRLVPALVGLACRPCARLGDADRLQRRPRRELPLQVVAGDEVAEARVERHDVVVLEVDLDERLPVVVALVDLDPVEHVAREVEVAHAERSRGRARTSRWPSNSRPFQFCSGDAAEVEARLVGEVRRAEELALEVVGPAVDRADDVRRVAAALEHDRLPVPADVRERARRRSALRTSACALSRQSSDVVVARVRHHQLVPDVAGRAREQQPLLGFEHRGIAIPGDRKLRRGAPQTGSPWRDWTSSLPFRRGIRLKSNQPNPTTRDDYGVYRPPRTALLSRPRERIA